MAPMDATIQGQCVEVDAVELPPLGFVSSRCPGAGGGSLALQTP